MKIKVPIDRLQPGLVTDQDIFSGSNLLLSKGSKVTTSLISLLKKRELTFIEVSENSELHIGYAGEITGSDQQHAFQATFKLSW